MRFTFLIMGCCILLCIHAFAQSDSTAPAAKLSPLPGELLLKLQGSATETQHKMLADTRKSLHRIRSQEEKLLQRMSGKDSLLHTAGLLSTTAFYADLEQRMTLASKTPTSVFSNVYSSKLDSLKTAMKFLASNKLLQSAESQVQYRQLMARYGDLQQQFNETATIGQLLERRQQNLLAGIPQLSGMAGFEKMQQQVATYKAKVKTCKELWENPSQLESKLTGMLARLPQFRQFFNGNADLSSIFQLGGGVNAANAANLQTREALNQFIAQATGAGTNVQARLQEGLAPAAGQVNSRVGDLQKLADLHKEDLSLSGNGKTIKPKKTFREHLQYTTNMQSARANNFFPATSDIGLALGYKLDERSVVGLGASGKIGWGRGFQDIRISGQGYSLRSYADLKLKGSIWVSGAWEFNYQQPYSTLRMLRIADNWKQSALLGLTKKINIGSAMFKTYEIKVLYDFLYRYRLPVTSPIVFRVGYSL